MRQVLSTASSGDPDTYLSLLAHPCPNATYTRKTGGLAAGDLVQTSTVDPHVEGGAARQPGLLLHAGCFPATPHTPEEPLIQAAYRQRPDCWGEAGLPVRMSHVQHSGVLPV